MRKSELRNNAFIALYVFALMLLCTNSSPMSSVVGTDSSVFTVMGRAMLNGKVMYKDLFDHKGLYIYFLNFIAAIINTRSFIGIFIVECVFMFLCARIVYALLSKYADSTASFIGMQIFMFFVMKRSLLEGGNLTEEYALLFQVCAIYLLCKDDGRHSYFFMMLQGIIAGIVLCLRPNMIMMWAGIALVAGSDMLRRKDFGRLAGNIAAGFAGLVIAALPVAIYAVLNDAVHDTLFGMFTYNFIYVGTSEASLLLNVIRCIIRMDETLLICLVLSVTIMLVQSRRALLTLYYLAMLLFSVVSVALSGRFFGHYYEYLIPFCIPLSCEVAVRIPSSKYKYAIAMIFVLTVMFGLRSVPSSIMLKLGKSLVSYEQYIKNNEPYYSEDERVLVTGNFAKLYNVLGVIPHDKYFYVPGTNYEVFTDPVDAQVASILSGENDVILVKYNDEKHEIYPETGRSEEITETLSRKYDLLYYDEKNNVAMYGKKRD